MFLSPLSCWCPLCSNVIREKHLCLTRFLPKDDDEWDDYRENKKDYTGLKIENLTQEQPKEEEEEETEAVEEL